jgi:hypothetical protein
MGQVISGRWETRTLQTIPQSDQHLKCGSDSLLSVGQLTHCINVHNQISFENETCGLPNMENTLCNALPHSGQI